VFSSINEAFEWMVSFTNFEKKPDLTKRGYRLDKMEYLLELFGNPHRAYKTLHVAGSKGKGSTCAFLASILTKAGFKTGVYSSPHLIDYRERITDNHTFFNKESYLDCINNIKDKLDSIEPSILPGGEPTTFELMTLAAFIIFKNEGCSWAVIETGLGGRLDSTNVVLPEASIITSIELEHTEILGDTLEKISFEKGGIIKQGRPIFTSNSRIEVLDTLSQIAKDRSSSFYATTKDFKYEITKEGGSLYYKGERYKLGIEGRVQGINGVLAIETVKQILPQIDIETIKQGLMEAKIPGRFQVVNLTPTVVLDGAHTKGSIEEVVKTFNSLYNKGTIIFGVIKGKDIISMANIVSKNFDNIIISTPGTFKESDIDFIEDIFTGLNCRVKKINSPLRAYNYAKEIGNPILVTGSFYMAGEIGRIIL